MESDGEDHDTDSDSDSGADDEEGGDSQTPREATHGTVAQHYMKLVCLAAGPPMAASLRDVLQQPGVRIGAGRAWIEAQYGSSGKSQDVAPPCSRQHSLSSAATGRRLPPSERPRATLAASSRSEGGGGGHHPRRSRESHRMARVWLAPRLGESMALGPRSHFLCLSLPITIAFASFSPFPPSWRRVRPSCWSQSHDPSFDMYPGWRLA